MARQAKADSGCREKKPLPLSQAKCAPPFRSFRPATGNIDQSDCKTKREDPTYRPRSVSSLLMRFKAMATVCGVCVCVCVWVDVVRVWFGVGLVSALVSRLGRRCIDTVSRNGRRENKIDGGEKVLKPEAGGQAGKWTAERTRRK